MKIPWTKLPMTFAPDLLRADLEGVPETAWKRHFNQSDFEGVWSSVSLRSLSGRVDDISPRGEVEEFKDTPLMEQCPHLRAAIEAFDFPKKSIRLLKLHAGSRVLEHSDIDLGLADGELRFHIPVKTNAKLEFVVANRRLVMGEGESWYIDFSQPHRIYNGGDTDRVHLLIDGRVNDWSLALLEKSAKEMVTETFDPPGVVEFAAFRERVFGDAELRAELMPVATKPQFVAAVVAAGNRLGFMFAADVVESAYKREFHEWMMRSAAL